MNQKNYPVKKPQHKNHKHVTKHKNNYYPKPQKTHQPVTLSQGFFNGNLATDMKFGSPGDHLSGYVHRKIRIKDRHGNETVASERQFFNSGKDFNIKIRDNGGHHEK